MPALVASKLINKEDIITYYDEAQISYKDVWHLDQCLAMHYGFWTPGVRNLKQALNTENKVLAELVGITKNDTVLDAGCGVGGSSVYLAKEIGCTVHGVTLSEAQVNQATNSAEKMGLRDNCTFSNIDFHETGFKNESFDVIWFTESFCHSNEPDQLLNEMYRILKPGGRIVIADGFLSSQLEKLNAQEAETMNIWLNNWAVNQVLPFQEMEEQLKEARFSNIKVKDFTAEIAKSSKKLYQFALVALFIGWAKRLIGQTYGNDITIKNTIAAKYQYIALKQKLWKYGVFTAKKPSAKRRFEK